MDLHTKKPKPKQKQKKILRGCHLGRIFFFYVKHLHPLKTSKITVPRHISISYTRVKYIYIYIYLIKSLSLSGY